MRPLLGCPSVPMSPRRHATQASCHAPGSHPSSLCAAGSFRRPFPFQMLCPSTVGRADPLGEAPTAVPAHFTRALRPPALPASLLEMSASNR